MGKALAIILGLIAMAGGVLLVIFKWWREFYELIFGCIPPILFIGGLIALIAGISSIKDAKRTKKLEQETAEEEKIEEAEPEEKVEKALEPEVKKEEVKPEPPPEKAPEAEKPVPPAVTELPEVQEEEIKRWKAGLSGGFYFLQSSDFQDAYGKSGPIIRGEFSYILPVKIESFDVWAAFGYFSKSGKLTITEEDIKLNFTTLSLAFRYLRNFSRFTPFAGLGIDYIFYKEKYPSDFPIESTSGSDLGFHLQAGTYFDIIPSLSAHAMIRYILSKTTQNEIEVNLGGVEYSIGLSYRFDF